MNRLLVGLTAFVVTSGGWASLPAFSQESLPVLDFCAMMSKADSERFTRKRLLLFALGDTALVEAGEELLNEKGEVVETRRELASVGGARHFSDVFMMTFPLRRFDTVISPVAAPSNWSGEDSLSLSAVRQAFANVQGGSFLAYSAACTDYLAIPRVESFSAKWVKKAVKKKVKGTEQTVTMWTISIEPEVSVAVYARSGSIFELVDKKVKKGGGIFDVVTDLGASIMSLAKQGTDQLGSQVSGATGWVIQDVKGWMEQLKSYQLKANAINNQIQEYREAAAQLEKLAESATGADLDSYTQEIHGYADKLNEATATLNEVMAVVDNLMGLLNSVDLDAQKWAQDTALAQSLGWAALVSGIPGPDCPVPQNPVDGVAALPPCTGSIDLPKREVGVAGMSERSSDYCERITESSSLGEIALCEARVRAENITLLIQKACKTIDGWRLYGPLQMAGEQNEAPGISLGNEEGVGKTDVFVAVREGPDGAETLGVAKVTRTGPGGTAGISDPSTLAWRTGAAPTGTRMEEHPQIGVSAGIGGMGSFLVSTENMDGLDFLPGLTVEVGYNLSRYLNLFDELWLRTHLDVMYASTPVKELDSTVMAFSAMAGPEGKYYLGRRLELFFMLAGGFTSVAVGNKDDDEDTARGGVAGVLGGGGIDILLTADFSARLSVLYRLNIGEIELKNEDKPDNSYQLLKVGSFSGLDAFAGLTYVF